MKGKRKWIHVVQREFKLIVLTPIIKIIGRGSGKMGEWTSDGYYVLQPWRIRNYVVPDLTDFQV